MATDLSTLTETELTELLSSATAYTKPEMISFLKDNVSISDEWIAGDSDHVTVYFTPISDLRALKYIALNQSWSGGGTVFFQLLRHPCRPRDHDVFEDWVYVAPSGQLKGGAPSGQTGLKVIPDAWLREYSSGKLAGGSYPDAGRAGLNRQLRSKYRYGSHRPSKPVMMLYPQDLVATLDPKEAITLWSNAADLTYEGGIDGKISQYAADGINGIYYKEADYCRSSDGGYKVDANGEYVRNIGSYYKVSRKPTDKVTMYRVNNDYISGQVVLTALEAAKGEIVLPWSEYEIRYFLGSASVYKGASNGQGTRAYVIWAPELLVQGGRRRWFMNEESAVRPSRAFLIISTQ